MEPIGVLNLMDDPEALEISQMMIGAMRMGLAPALNGAGVDLPVMQSILISSAAIMSGITVGHMIAVGNFNEKADLATARKAIRAAFDFGVEQGKIEAMNAMVKSGLGGNA